MEEKDLIKMIKKKADVKTHLENDKDRLIKNAYEYFKGVRDGQIAYARVLLELI